MCKIKTRFRKAESVTGYKIAFEKYGKFYSIYTGIEYKVGSVKDVDHNYKSNIESLENKYGSDKFYFWKNVWNTYDNFYEPKMKNKTGVILSLSDAYDFIYDNKHITEYVILEMTISGGLYNAKFDDSKTVIGNHIDSITKLSKQEIESKISEIKNKIKAQLPDEK